MDSFDRFEETELPQEKFFNKLSDDSCSNVDYEHAVRVWLWATTTMFICSMMFFLQTFLKKLDKLALITLSVKKKSVESLVG